MHADWNYFNYGFWLVFMFFYISTKISFFFFPMFQCEWVNVTFNFHNESNSLFLNEWETCSMYILNPPPFKMGGGCCALSVFFSNMQFEGGCTIARWVNVSIICTICTCFSMIFCIILYNCYKKLYNNHKNKKKGLPFFLFLSVLLPIFFCIPCSFFLLSYLLAVHQLYAIWGIFTTKTFLVQNFFVILVYFCLQKA